MIPASKKKALIRISIPQRWNRALLRIIRSKLLNTPIIGRVYIDKKWNFEVLQKLKSAPTRSIQYYLSKIIPGRTRSML